MEQFAVAPLFDFAPHKLQREDMLGLIREFASHDAFRSAVVEELELDEDFYRRPLRPEDLDFLKFQKPVSAETVSRLPSLASNRLLLSINELGIARMPRSGEAQEMARFTQFYGDGNQVLAQRIRPFLENYAFSYLAGDDGAGETTVDGTMRLQALLDVEREHWDDLFAMLIRNNYLEQGLKFILVQRWSLGTSKHAALARAASSAYFSAVPQEDWPVFNGKSLHEGLLNEVARHCGVSRRSHSYWQFYLPTSLAKVNLLYALGSRPDRAFALLGAAFAAEAESIAFVAALLKACPHLSRLGGIKAADSRHSAIGLVERFGRAHAALTQRYGAAGTDRVAQGLTAGIRLAERGRWDLGEQLRWLSSIERYCDWARVIDRRIQAECPEIDRETFVEPREMCSTTHVHNDHRLVVIESGDMIFWGNLGMQLSMTVGDMVLIPDGRLHGSTVVSEECTYHQPIIPNEWIADLLSETAIRQPDQQALATGTA